MAFTTPHPADVLREELRHRRIAEYLHTHYGGALGAYPVLPAAGPAASLPPPVQQPEPTQHDKTRAVFGVLDANRSGRIEEEEWAQGLKAANFGLSEETVKELFQDLGDGGLSAWAGFACNHTMLLDALYWRQKRVAEATGQRQYGESAAPALSSTVGRAEEDLQKAEQAQADEEKSLQSAKDEDEKLQGELKVAEEKFREAVQESDQKATASSEAKQEVARHWPETQRKMGELRSAEMAFQSLTLRSKAAAENERELEAALEAARRDRARLEEELHKAEGTRDGLQEEVKKAEEPEERARQAETAMAEAQRGEQQRCEELRSARVSADAQQHKKQSCEGRTEGAKHQVEAAKVRLQKANDAVSSNDERLSAAAAALEHGPGTEADGKLTAEVEKENELVQQEITLRRDRKALEQREAAFRQDADTFTGSPQRRSIQNSPPTSA